MNQHEIILPIVIIIGLIVCLFISTSGFYKYRNYAECLDKQINMHVCKELFNIPVNVNK